MKPTAIKVAEDLQSIFKNVEDVYRDNPSEAVFLMKDIVNLLKDYGLPEPDFAGYGNFLISNLDQYGARAKQRKVGLKIEAALKARGLSQREFAKLIGRSTAEVSRMISGQNMEISTINRIEHVLMIRILDV